MLRERVFDSQGARLVFMLVAECPVFIIDETLLCDSRVRDVRICVCVCVCVWKCVLYLIIDGSAFDVGLVYEYVFCV